MTNNPQLLTTNNSSIHHLSRAHELCFLCGPAFEDDALERGGHARGEVAAHLWRDRAHRLVRALDEAVGFAVSQRAVMADQVCGELHDHSRAAVAPPAAEARFDPFQLLLHLAGENASVASGIPSFGGGSREGDKSPDTRRLGSDLRLAKIDATQSVLVVDGELEESEVEDDFGSLDFESLAFDSLAFDSFFDAAELPERP